VIFSLCSLSKSDCRHHLSNIGDGNNPHHAPHFHLSHDRLGWACYIEWLHDQWIRKYWSNEFIQLPNWVEPFWFYSEYILTKISTILLELLFKEQRLLKNLELPSVILDFGNLSLVDFLLIFRIRLLKLINTSVAIWTEICTLTNMYFGYHLANDKSEIKQKMNLIIVTGGTLHV
jgi:uncharacterized membrane protein